MLVEDHADTVFLMQKLLTARGHDVRVAQTVADAIRTIAAAEFDLIVSDIGLPDGTGLDLIRHVRGELKRNTPAVAVTGYGMEEDVARAREAGFDVHVTKPVNLIQLERVMRDLARPG
jgi:CheY-like chemotaxis protein